MPQFTPSAAAPSITASRAAGLLPAQGLRHGPGAMPEAGSHRRTALAVGVVPPTVLMALLAVVAGLIEPATGLALFVAGLAWLVFEMHRYLRRMDAELDTELRAGPWP